MRLIFSFPIRHATWHAALTHFIGSWREPTRQSQRIYAGAQPPTANNIVGRGEDAIAGVRSTQRCRTRRCGRAARHGPAQLCCASGGDLACPWPVPSAARSRLRDRGGCGRCGMRRRQRVAVRKGNCWGLGAPMGHPGPVERSLEWPELERRNRRLGSTRDG